MADQFKPLDVDGARARLRGARARVDRLPDHAKRGVIPPGTVAVLLDALADLGRALDRIVVLERALLGRDAEVVRLDAIARTWEQRWEGEDKARQRAEARVAELERTAEADRVARETALDAVRRREEYIEKLLRDPCPACAAMGARVRHVAELERRLARAMGVIANYDTAFAGLGGTSDQMDDAEADGKALLAAYAEDHSPGEVGR